jgi:hypothetical protein
MEEATNWSFLGINSKNLLEEDCEWNPNLEVYYSTVTYSNHKKVQAYNSRVLRMKEVAMTYD